MSVDKGFQRIAGFKKGTTWGTPVACGSGDGVELLSETFTNAKSDYVEDQQLAGAASQRAGAVGNRIVRGELVTGARYEGLEVILAQILGTAGAPTTVDTSAKQHKLRVNDVVEGVFGTLALKKGIPNVHEFSSVKWTGFSLKCSQGARAEITLRGVAHDLAENTASGTNNNTTIASVTLPTNREFLHFRQMAVRINAQAGAALAAADKVWVTDFTVNVNRNLKEDDFTTEFGDRISEPTPSGFLTVDGALTFSKYIDGTGGNSPFFPGQLAKTPYKLDATWLGDTLAGAATQKFSWVVALPYIILSEGAPPTDGPGVKSWSVNFKGWRVTAAPTGMTGITEPIGLDIFSQRTTDPLA